MIKQHLTGIIIGILLTLTIGSIYITYKTYTQTNSNTAAIQSIVNFLNSQIKPATK